MLTQDRHLDHILGLGGLISTLARWENVDKIEIWGGEETLERVETLIYGVVLQEKQVSTILHLLLPLNLNYWKRKNLQLARFQFSIGGVIVLVMYLKNIHTVHFW